jgi:hypothetical protein
MAQKMTRKNCPFRAEINDFGWRSVWGHFPFPLLGILYCGYEQQVEKEVDFGQQPQELQLAL